MHNAANNKDTKNIHMKNHSDKGGSMFKEYWNNDVLGATIFT